MDFIGYFVVFYDIVIVLKRVIFDHTSTTVLRTTVLHTTALLRRLYIKASCRASCRVSCKAFVRVNFLDICVNAKPSYEYRRYVSDTRPYRDTEVSAIRIGSIEYRPQDCIQLLKWSSWRHFNMELEAPVTDSSSIWRLHICTRPCNP